MDEDDELQVTKHTVYIEVPDELLMEYGVIPDTRPPVVIPLRIKIRWRISDARTHAARRVYRIIAGHPVPDDDYYE